MNNEVITIWSFGISILGTVFGFLSLLLAIYISNNTMKIRNNFAKKHLQNRYRKTKDSILLQMNTSYELIRDFNELDSKNIKESIISIRIYNDILTFKTKKKLSKLKRKVNKPDNDTYTRINEIGEILFEIIKRLDNELDEHNEFVKETTK